VFSFLLGRSTIASSIGHHSFFPPLTEALSLSALKVSIFSGLFIQLVFNRDLNKHYPSSSAIISKFWIASTESQPFLKKYKQIGN